MVSLVRKAAVALGAQAGARMGAWRVHAYGGLAELRLDEARVPPLRAPDELLVRVHSSSLNPLDIAMIGEELDFRRSRSDNGATATTMTLSAGGYGRRALNTLRALEGARGGSGAGGAGVEFPLVVGRDFAGEVVVAGAATRLRRGVRVWGVLPPHWPGAHAQYVVVKERWVGTAVGFLSSSGVVTRL